MRNSVYTIIACLILLPSVVFAAVSVDSQAQGNTTGSSISFTDTISSFSNSQVIIAVTSRQLTAAGARTITGVTVNGSNATLDASSSLINGVSAQELSNIWRFAATTSGAQAISVTFSGTVASGQATSTVLNGVDSSTPLDTEGCNSLAGSSAEGQVQLTTGKSGDYFVDGIFLRTTNAITAGASQTGGNRLPGSGQSGSSYKAATTTGAQTMYWTYTSATADWVTCAAAYMPVQSGGGGSFVNGLSFILRWLW